MIKKLKLWFLNKGKKIILKTNKLEKPKSNYADVGLYF